MSSKHRWSPVDKIISEIEALKHPSAADLAAIVTAVERKAMQNGGGPVPNSGGGPPGKDDDPPRGP